MSVVGVLLCAGSSSRMGFDKLRCTVGGRNAIQRCRDALILGGVERLVFVAGKDNATYLHQLPCSVPSNVVMGGDCRTQSVRNALEAECVAWQAQDIALIHDCARCMVDPKLVQACIDSARLYGSGVAAIGLTDTVLRFEHHDELAYLKENAPREGLFRMQTPQAFRYEPILRAHRLADAPATDDSTLYALNCGLPVALVTGSEDNRKLTTPADMDWLRERLTCTKYGTGYDTHRLIAGRELVLGGVKIPYEKGLLGHSDADVLIHAICDALLGACALGDIGRHFSDKDPKYKGIDSRVLLRECVSMVQKRGIEITNIDATVIAERPKLAPYAERMRENIASDCSIDVDCVSVKATTTEGMNDEGRGLCISASAIVGLRCPI